MWFLIPSFAFFKLLLVASVLTAPVSYVCYPQNGVLIVECNVNYEAKYGCSTYSYNYIRFLTCQMPDLPRNFFKDYTYRIKTVDISKLHGETMATNNNPLSNLTYLENLLANDNNLTTIPKNMLTNTNLHYLDVSDNRIAQIEAIGKCGAKNLQTLLLSNNNITSISHTTFNGLSELTILDLSFNNLHTLAHGSLFDQLTNLKHLSLAYTNLSHFSFGMVVGCQQLELLNISGNHIHTIDVGFHSMVFRNLRRIDMNFSEIVEIDELMDARIFASLNYLNIQNNRFNCSHLRSILSAFDERNLTLEMAPHTKATISSTVRGVSCIADDAAVMVTTESITPITQMIQTHSIIAFDDTNRTDSMELKTFQAVQQRMYQLIIVVLIVVVIIATLIIMSIFGIPLDLNGIHIFSRKRQNLFAPQVRHRQLKDDQQESVAL